MEAGILTLDDFRVVGKTVILRVDINSPIDRSTGELADDNRIRKSLPTIRELSDAGAKTVILAHQGDIEDYHNLVSLEPHSRRLAELLARPVTFLDDIAGPSAREQIRSLKDGELLLLNNVRYLTEEVSTFVNYVKLSPADLARTWLVRSLAPLADYFVCEAFAAAHRYSPSLIGFAEVLPSAGGRLLVQELSALSKLKEEPVHPCIFLLGGARPADAFSMMEYVLEQGAADVVLTSGLVGEIMLLAKGYALGEQTESLIRDKGLWSFVENSKGLLSRFPDKIWTPLDVAYVADETRHECDIQELPLPYLLVDIGEKTVQKYCQAIQHAATIFINGPAGVYEKPQSAFGTESLWKAATEAKGFSVIGGGDSVAAAKHFGVREKFGYVCTAGGGMVRFLSGQPLPVIDALRRAAQRYSVQQEALHAIH